MCSLSPHPDSREVLREKDQHRGPQKLPCPPASRRSNPSHVLEGGTRPSFSALPLVFPCWKRPMGSKTHVDRCHRPPVRGRAWAVRFSGARTWDTGWETT